MTEKLKETVSGGIGDKVQKAGIFFPKIISGMSNGYGKITA